MFSSCRIRKLCPSLLDWLSDILNYYIPFTYYKSKEQKINFSTRLLYCLSICLSSLCLIHVMKDQKHYWLRILPLEVCMKSVWKHLNWGGKNSLLKGWLTGSYYSENLQELGIREEPNKFFEIICISSSTLLQLLFIIVPFRTFTHIWTFFFLITPSWNFNTWFRLFHSYSLTLGVKYLRFFTSCKKHSLY